MAENSLQQLSTMIELRWPDLPKAGRKQLSESLRLTATNKGFFVDGSRVWASTTRTDEPPQVVLNLEASEGLAHPVRARYYTVMSLTDGNPEELEVVVGFFAGCLENFKKDIERHRPPNIERGPASDEALKNLHRSVERLAQQVRILLHDSEAWKDTPQIEQDVEDSLSSLLKELARPVDETDSVIIERLSTRLSKYVVGHEQSKAEGETAEALERLEESVLDVMAAMDGTDADVPAALDAVESLAELAKFSELEKPDEVDPAEWEKFSQAAEAHPAGLFHLSFEWRAKTAIKATSKSLPLGIGTALGVGGAIQKAIAEGLGAISGPVSAVVTVVLATFAANFHRAGKDDSDDPVLP